MDRYKIVDTCEQNPPLFDSGRGFIFVVCNLGSLLFEGFDVLTRGLVHSNIRLLLGSRLLSSDNR